MSENTRPEAVIKAAIEDKVTRSQQEGDSAQAGLARRLLTGYNWLVEAGLEGYSGPLAIFDWLYYPGVTSRDRHQLTISPIKIALMEGISIAEGRPNQERLRLHLFYQYQISVDSGLRDLLQFKVGTKYLMFKGIRPDYLDLWPYKMRKTR